MSVRMWACEHFFLSAHICDRVSTLLTDHVFSEGIGVFLCYIAAGEAPLQSCPSGSPDYISKH